MNAKQSLKAASKHIADLEDFNQRAVAEIKALNACIDSVIAKEKAYCDWCEEASECQKAEKGTGCGEWWMMLHPVIEEGSDDGADSKGILSASPDCGEGT